jgi:hypothetical protein
MRAGSPHLLEVSERAKQGYEAGFSRERAW